MLSSCPLCWHGCGFVSADTTPCVWRLGSGNAGSHPCICSSHICAHWAPSTACLNGHCAWNCLNLWCPLHTAGYSKIQQFGCVCIPTSWSSLLPGFLIGHKTWFLKSKNKWCRQVSPKRVRHGMAFYWKKERMKVLKSKNLLRTWPSTDQGCFWRYWLLLPKGKFWKKLSVRTREEALWEPASVKVCLPLSRETDYIYIYIYSSIYIYFSLSIVYTIYSALVTFILFEIDPFTLMQSDL